MHALEGHATAGGLPPIPQACPYAADCMMRTPCCPRLPWSPAGCELTIEDKELLVARVPCSCEPATMQERDLFKPSLLSSKLVR